MEEKFLEQIKDILRGKSIIMCPNCNECLLSYNTWVRSWTCLSKSCGYKTMEFPPPEHFAKMFELRQMLQDLEYLKEVSEAMDEEEQLVKEAEDET